MSQHRDVPVVPTKDSHGKVNGQLLPIVNRYERTGPFSLGKGVEQVYVTTIAPGAVKGPHLHLRRSGFFTVLRGEVAVVIRRGKSRYEVERASGARPRTVYVPAGTPSALVNLGADEAWVINVVESAWRKEDPDDALVPAWDFDFEVLRRGRA